MPCKTMLWTTMIVATIAIVLLFGIHHQEVEGMKHPPMDPNTTGESSKRLARINVSQHPMKHGRKKQITQYFAKNHFGNPEHHIIVHPNDFIQTVERLTGKPGPSEHPSARQWPRTTPNVKASPDAQPRGQQKILSPNSSISINSTTATQLQIEPADGIVVFELIPEWEVMASIIQICNKGAVPQHFEVRVLNEGISLSEMFKIQPTSGVVGAKKEETIYLTFEHNSAPLGNVKFVVETHEAGKENDGNAKSTWEFSSILEQNDDGKMK